MSQKPSSKRVDWTRDELILALDVYFSFSYPFRDKGASKAIEELSLLLRQLPIHPERLAIKKFRNVNGVRLKLANLQYHDPEVLGGSPHGNKLDKVVFDEFCHDHARLREFAAAIREGAMELNSADAPAVEDEDMTAVEGQILFRVHKLRERDQGIVKRRKAQVLKREGRLHCEVCAFDFVRKYGELGADFIECHHVKPLSQLQSSERTKLSDLALVCANCHRMLHRTKPVGSIEALRALIEQQQ